MSMTSDDLESRSRSPTFELDKYLVVGYLYTKLEHHSLIISQDNEWKHGSDGWSDGHPGGFSLYEG
jgi:hypothetical protein